MTRSKLFLVTAAVLAVCAMAVMPWTLATKPLAESIGEEMRRTTGLGLATEGRATFALLPVPRVKLENVSLQTPQGEEVARARQLRGELRLLPLLLGRMELVEVTLVQPRLDLSRVGTLRELWAMLNAHTGREIESRRNGTARGRHVGRLIIIDGLVLTRAKDEAPALANQVNLVVYWPSLAGPLAVAGTTQWHGEPVDIRLDSLSPAAIGDGRASPLAVQLQSPFGDLAFKGDVSGAEDPQLNGDLRVSTRSLRWADSQFGGVVPLGHLVESFSLAGPVSMSSRGLSLPQASIEIDRRRIDGALTARFEQARLAVSGTLAAEELQLERFLRPLLPARGADGSWSRDTLGTRGLDHADLDLRLSINKAYFGRMPIDNLAGSMQIKNGRLEIALGRAGLHGGTVKGRLTASPSPAGYDVRMSGQADKVDLLGLLNDAGNITRLSGRGTAQFQLEAAGTSFAELAHGLRGQGQFDIAAGSISGVNLPELARRAEVRPLAAALEWRGGRTPFESITGQVTISEGIADVGTMEMTTPGVRGLMTGHVLVGDRRLLLDATVTPPKAAASAVPSGFPLKIRGSWDDPAVLPDVDALIQRSSATAPFFVTPPPQVPPADLTSAGGTLQ